jgi:hypothetical protein
MRFPEVTYFFEDGIIMGQSNGYTNKSPKDLHTGWERITLINYSNHGCMLNAHIWIAAV